MIPDPAERAKFDEQRRNFTDDASCKHRLQRRFCAQCDQDDLEEMYRKAPIAIAHLRNIWKRSGVLGDSPHEENYRDAILASQALGVKFPTAEDIQEAMKD